jgi:hypothetical protein
VSLGWRLSVCCSGHCAGRSDQEAHALRVQPDGAFSRGAAAHAPRSPRKLRRRPRFPPLRNLRCHLRLRDAMLYVVALTLNPGTNLNHVQAALMPAPLLVQVWKLIVGQLYPRACWRLGRTSHAVRWAKRARLSFVGWILEIDRAGWSKSPGRGWTTTAATRRRLDEVAVSKPRV